MKIAHELIDFIYKSPTAFHAVENIKNTLLENGFVYLKENEIWDLKLGKNYFVIKNNSSIIAFKIPQKSFTGYNIVSSHSDSPSFKIKENAQMISAGYTTLNTERYGGMIMSSWLDRPLSIAGRVIVKQNGEYLEKLINIDKDLLIMPNIAIHMDRTVNEGKKFNAQTDTIPLIGSADSKDKLDALIANELGAEVSDILSTDLFLYPREKGTIIGIDNEFIGSPRLDDLQCVFTSMKGFIDSDDVQNIAVLAVFDNEEVGSGTKQGAASTFLFDSLTRINNAFDKTNEDYLISLTNSFMISADNAHAVHPNQGSYADVTNKPYINKGVVIKYNANQKYTTDAISAAIFKDIVKKTKHNYQTFANRSDLMGGSTLGNISNTQVALNTVDVGLPQLAMHSSYELAGVKDTADFIDICKAFYESSINKTANGYSIK